MAELLFPLQFKRQYANSLDVDSLFATEADMNAYLTSARRYAGQVVTCNELEGRVFILNNAKDTWLDVTANVDLSGYYTTAQTYSKVEVDNLIFNLSGGTGVTYLKNLLDVSSGITLATHGQALVFNSSLNLWVNSSVTIDLSPYYTSAQTNAIFYTSAQTAALFSPIGHNHALSGLTDVVTGATDGQFLQYNSVLGKWEPVTASGLTGNFVAKSGDVMSGELSFDFMVGSSDRILFVDTGGTVKEGEEIVSLYFTDPTLISELSGETNWSGRTFTNTGLTAVTLYEGQRYIDANYSYEYFGGNLYRSFYADKDHNHNDLYYTQTQLSPSAGTAVLDYRYITYAALSGLTLASLADVSLNISTLTNNSFLKYDTTSGWTNYNLDLTALTWKPEAVLTGRTVMGVSGLTGGGTLNNDIYISHATKTVSQTTTTPSLSNIVVGLTFDAYGHVNTWTTADFSGTIPQFLPDLGDVTITNITQNTFQHLWHNGSQWVNTTLNISRVSGLTDSLANCVKYNPTSTPQIINGNVVLNNDLTVQGNLNVNGTVSTLNTEQLYIKDNVVTLNYGETGAGVSGGTGIAGLVIDRGTRPDYYIIYQDDPSTSGGTVKIGIDSNLKNVMTMVETPIDSAVTFWSPNDATGFIDMSASFIFDKATSTMFVTNIVTTGLTINNTITNISTNSGLTEGDDTLSTTLAIKTYIDSQIGAENYWLATGDTLTPESAYTNLYIPSGITAQTFYTNYLTLLSGATIYNISTNSGLTEGDESVSTTKAVKDYVDYLSWKNWYYIPTATTIRIAENTQNIVFGNYYVVGDLQLDGDLVILNGALHQTGSTTGSGNITFFDFYSKYEVNQLLTGLTGSYYSLSGGTIYGDIIPDGDGLRSLGSSGYQWLDVWVSGGTIYLDRIPLSTDGVDLLWSGSTLGTKYLTGLTDVSVSSPNDGQVLSYSAGTWINIDITGDTGNINGSVFITNIAPQGTGNVGSKVYSSGGVVLDSCLTDTQLVTVYVLALPGHTNWNSVITLNGSAITMTASSDQPLFTGSININLSGATGVTVLHEDGASHHTIIYQEVPPVINLAQFTGGYPGSQTELKAGDTYDFYLETDVPIVNIQFDNYGAYGSATYPVTSGTGHTIANVVIANRGTSTVAYGAKVRVQKSTGSWSDWYLTENDGSVDGVNKVYLNNLYPTITFGSVTYPGSQLALKDNEQATVSNTVTNYTTIAYDSPNSDLVIESASTYETNKIVTRTGGTYNIVTNNFRITANRAANDATTTNQRIVQIAHVACTLTVTEPSRLRSGGNDGTSAQNHTITITANQQLLSAPTLNSAASGGTWQGSGFVGGPTVWTRSLQVTDDMVKQTYSWGSIAGTNLAGIITTSITGDGNYILGGFVSRQITLAAFANEATMNVAARDYTKVTLSWDYNTNVNQRAAVGTTVPPPQPNYWCLNAVDTNPCTIRILDTEQTNASSQASTITIEETI